MDLVLQIWGGTLYLLNKILFSVSETLPSASRRQLKIVGWIVYLLGVPAWVIILVGEHNWIAASIEFGGIPAMLFGLYVVIKGEVINKSYDLLTSIITYFFVILGSGYSFYQYGGISSTTQVFEIGVMVGFLLGGYLLAKDNIYGWLCFALMNVSMGSLMLLQQKPVLAMQQGLSLCFVIFGLITMFKNQKARAFD
ncbi:hypothetical protein KDN34_07455 [Shewanella yunxiaonensis]|uniref:Nicotinamide riboside transporter PnuC n=1 Tax=Shewanella yunxiaonensis TaxID=2829809 RepID=A0ABX7YYJ7_9GAMM|nr:MULTISPECIES: hypothetical protein [Shewanella]MDF0534860.1 hypothetical protein [Shewanella sp. A32]QUN07251.1 hypothetical protein KDN34_07455 [Shewanella yunxiaonensis]